MEIILHCSIIYTPAYAASRTKCPNKYSKIFQFAPACLVHCLKLSALIQPISCFWCCSYSTSECCHGHMCALGTFLISKSDLGSVLADNDPSLLLHSVVEHLDWPQNIRFRESIQRELVWCGYQQLVAGNNLLSYLLVEYKLYIDETCRMLYFKLKLKFNFTILYSCVYIQKISLPKLSKGLVTIL